MTGPPPIDPGFGRFEGTVTDGAGTPIYDAEVLLPYGDAQYWGGKTDTKGKFRFDFKASDYAGVSPVGLIIRKADHRSRSFFFKSVTEGSTVSIDATGANTGLPFLGFGEFIPEGGEWIWHVGDDAFGGSNNSGLQMKAVGLSKYLKIVDWTASQRALYKSATIEVWGRGVQTSVCPGNRFGLYSTTQAVSAETIPGDTPASGDYGVYTFTLATTAFTADGALLFGVKAGTCPSASGYDDFEVTQIFVTLKP